MYRGSIRGKFVRDVNEKLISPAGLDERTWVRAIEDLTEWFEIAVWRQLPL